MHLWPSERLRDSFKLQYLNNLEWNLRRMKSSKNNKNQSSNEEQLSGNNETNTNNKNQILGCAITVLADLLMILSCCYCCGGIYKRRMTSLRMKANEPATLNRDNINGDEINEEPQNVLHTEGGNGNSASTSAATGISDLEQLLQQKTFTRSEIERLTSVLHSKTTESPSDDSLEKHGDKRDSFHASISAPIGTSGLLKENASPAELAKYYMGSRPIDQAPGQDLKLLPRTPITAVAQKTANSLANLENGFATPRSRGRSAMYTMARTPYSRSPSTFSQQGIKSDYGHDAALTSSQGHERKMALKRRSSVLDDDIGSGGPLRRIRQKANLLSQREKKELGYPAFQQLDSSGQNLLLTDEPEPKVSNYALVPTKATQTANKILQHLDKPSSIEKKLSSTLAGMKEKTPNKLRLDMLHGQALRSLEKVDSPKFDPISYNIQKAVISESTLQRNDKTEENSLRKSPAPHNMLTLVNGGMPDTLKNKTPVVEYIDLPSKVTEEPQKKLAFQMSAPEDMFEIDDDDDDIHDNGHVSLPLVESNKPETSVADIIKAPTLLEVSKTTELVTHNKPMFSEVSKVPEHVALKEEKEDKKDVSTPSQKTDFGFSGGSVGKQGLGFKIPISSPSVATTQTSVLTNSTLKMENNASVKVSPFAFSANEVSEFKPNAGSDPKEVAPVSVFNSVTKNDNVKVTASNKDENGNLNGNDLKSTNLFGKPETLSPAVLAVTSADGIFSFGTSNKNLSTPDTTHASNPPTFPSMAPFSASASTTTTTTTTMAALTTTTTAPAVVFSTSVSPQVFSFGSATSTPPTTSVAETANTSTSSSSPFATTTTTQSGLFGSSSSAAASSSTTTGSGLFSFSSPAAAISTTTTTGNGLFGFSSAAAATSTTTTTTTGNGLFGFSSPAAATSTTTASGLFGFSSPAAATSTTTTGSAPFGFSSPATTTSITATTTGSGLFGFSSPAVATSTTTTTGGGLFGLSSSTATTSTTTAATGSGLFGFSSPAAATSATTAATGSGLFGFSSPAVATSTTTTGSGLFSFGSSTAAPSTTSSQSHGSFFNVTNGFQTSTHASSTSSLFGSSAPAFISTPSFGGSSAPAFVSTPSFGISSVGSTSEVKSNSTTGSTTSIFGSSWQQPQQSSGLGSTFTSSPSTPMFSFGASSTPTPSFATAGASNPSFGGPSVFGNSTPVFGAVAATTPNNNIGNNNSSDQMSMEDSMAEDSMQTHSPVSPFGQAPASTPGFMFGSATPTPTPSLTPAPISFSFGSQPNQAPPPQNPFQSSSVEFNAGGGSFSLGSGGEKSNRRIVRVMKSKNRKK